MYLKNAATTVLVHGDIVNRSGIKEEPGKISRFAPQTQDTRDRAGKNRVMLLPIY